jgi:hypothetical protein
MKKSKWPDFIVTLAFRFIGGAILGCVFAVGCGLVGGLIAVCKTPYWQTPWYKGIDANRQKGAPREPMEPV